MQKIENLFKGESVEFVNSEEDTIKEIIQYFTDGLFPIEMCSNELTEITIQMNLEELIFILQQSPKFTIRTKQKSYKCNSLGIISSKTILAHLQSNPASTEFFYDYDEKNNEFQKIINFFNWEEISINLNEAYSILQISEQLGITYLIDPLKFFITEMEKIERNSKESY